MKKYDVITSGYVSMDRIIKVLSPVKTGFTSIVENFDNAKIYYGGCSVNIAYALSKLGMLALPYIRVGEDWKEIGFYDFLTEAGVSLDATEVIANETTSNCYMIEDPNKEHVTIFYPGAMDEKYSKPMEETFFKNARLGVITVGARKDNEEFLKQCKKNNLPLVFGMKADFKAFPKEFLLELLSYAKIIFANATERKAIEEMFMLDSITDFFEIANAEVIVITHGSKGSVCYGKTSDGFKTEKIGIVTCQDVVDTTGSGDAYISGFIYGWLNAYSAVECCHMGRVLSSFIIEAKGCCTNAPKLERFIERYKTIREA